MYSYPNLIGLPPDEIYKVWKRVQKLDFEWIYGGWYSVAVIKTGKQSILHSLQQIIKVITNSTSHKIFAESIPENSAM